MKTIFSGKDAILKGMSKGILITKFLLKSPLRWHYGKLRLSKDEVSSDHSLNWNIQYNCVGLIKFKLSCMTDG